VVLAHPVSTHVLPVLVQLHLANRVKQQQIEFQLPTAVVNLDFMKPVPLVLLVRIRVPPVQDQLHLASPVQPQQIGYLQLIVLV